MAETSPSEKSPWHSRLVRAWRRLRGLPIASNGCWCAECLFPQSVARLQGVDGEWIVFAQRPPLPPAQQHALAERLKARDNG